MSYNVRVFDLYNWTKNKESRNNIFSFIRNEAPDVICFQEYFNSSNKNYFPVHDSLIKHQSFKYHHIYYTNNINGNSFGIATYSNFKIINKQNHTFEGTNNLFISSDILVKQDTVRILNCHLESIRLNQDDYNLMDSLSSVGEERRRTVMKGLLNRIQQAFVKRAVQAEKINSFINQSPYPVICSGDFNDTPNSYTYNKIASTLSDSYLTTNSFHGGTYYRFFPSFRIDFLLYSDEISCCDFKTINVELSDHKPIKGTYHIVSRK
jgi:endonuclease/exonuclease/phosphatase family metal-dependent hydrolase